MEGEVAVLNPALPKARVHFLDKTPLPPVGTGTSFFLKRSHALTDPKQPFSFRWFIPEIIKQRTAFRDIASPQLR